ncbi:MAG: recombination protein RecR [Actinobacteria bacterium]|nr:MAG: recombination protein RecR [Actinomycetota bacterium]
MQYPQPLARLIDELQKLPSIGPKTAQRLAFHIMRAPKEDAEKLSAAVAEVRESVRYCHRCFNFTDQELCDVCRDGRRDASLICVVEEARDVFAIEKTGEYNGLYHVLQGAISPIENVGPDEIRMAELMRRLQDGSVEEIIVATNPNVEGEATAMYLARLVKPLGVTLTRLASGLPVGGDLEYADEVTLGRALSGRRRL